MATAWNWWFHIGGNTYATWLRGDPRGWRERHHRRHVEGDYKRPPKPGTGEDELALSKALMPREAVRLTVDLRRVALIALVMTLIANGVEVLIASLDDHHLHILARVRDGQTRRRMGWAKLAATKKVKEALAHMKAHGTSVGLDLADGEGIWAKGTKATPVTGRAHQLSVIPYIRDHAKRGAILYMTAGVVRYLHKLDQSPRHRRGS